MREETTKYEIKPQETDDTAETGLDVVTDLILDSSIPAPIRRNAFKAFGQLCTAAVDWPVAYFEGKAAESRARTDARIKIIKENANQIAQQLKVNPEYVHRAGNKFAEKIIGGQLYLDAMSAIAAGELKNNKSDNPTNQGVSESNKEQSANSTNENANSSEEKIISDEWLNSFDTEARQKSTEDMQMLFGHLLAGEIKEPGTHSIKTVKILAQLDREVTQLFKKLCSFATASVSVKPKEIVAVNVFSLSEEPLSVFNLEKYGISLSVINTLVEYELVAESDWEYRSITAPAFVFQNKKRYWVVHHPVENRDDPRELRLYGLRLTRAGIDLYNLYNLIGLDYEDSTTEYTEDLKKFFESKNLKITEYEFDNFWKEVDKLSKLRSG